jgi:hypothetical protein
MAPAALRSARVVHKFGDSLNHYNHCYCHVAHSLRSLASSGSLRLHGKMYELGTGGKDYLLCRRCRKRANGSGHRLRRRLARQGARPLDGQKQGAD